MGAWIGVAFPLWWASGCIIDLGLSPAQRFDYWVWFLKKCVEFQAIICYFSVLDILFLYPKGIIF
jgi:hypothetical protein